MQEFDLREGATRIGRSASCAITIDDPAISREHAEIVVERDSARIRDLGSRNGVRVNGVRIVGELALKDGDKIRVGQQDLVFAADEDSRVRSLARTSRMRTCQKCDVPYAVDRSPTCPVCRSSSIEAEETMPEEISTPVQPADRTTWWMLLHAELVERALATERFAEAEQALRRVDEALASAMRANERYDDAALEPVLSAATRLAREQRDARWLAWTLETLRAFRVAPSGALLAELESTPPDLMHRAHVALSAYVTEMRPSTPSLEGLAAIAVELGSNREAPETEPMSRAS